MQLRLGDFPDRDAVLDGLRGAGPRGDLSARLTHQGFVVSGALPESALPGHMRVLQSVGLDPSMLHEQQHQQHLAQGGGQDQQPPPKTLAWLHKLIEDFFEFRTRQFAVRRDTAGAAAASSGGMAYMLSDEDDRASRNNMIVPSAITDDVAYFLFAMISERYGVPTVVAQQAEVALQTANFFASRDVTAALFFALLKTPAFDSNDVRFVVEARRVMRSSLVSQRGVDGVLRWFIPLRAVPHVVRRASNHPWARPLLQKVHSAFEGLFRRQRIKARDAAAAAAAARASSASSSPASSSSARQQNAQPATAPLFTLPAPQHLSLVPPYSADHPLVGRGPYVDVRGSEAFLAAQPPQLVIGADYLLCMLFVNFIDHREGALRAAAEGRPLEHIANRRAGRVAAEMVLQGDDAAQWAKLGMFAHEIDAAAEEAAAAATNRAPRISALDELRLGQQATAASKGAAASVADGGPADITSQQSSFFSAEPAAIAAQTLRLQHGSPPQQQQALTRQQMQFVAAQKREQREAALIPPRVVHLYTV